MKGRRNSDSNAGSVFDSNTGSVFDSDDEVMGDVSDRESDSESEKDHVVNQHDSRGDWETGSTISMNTKHKKPLKHLKKEKDLHFKDFNDFADKIVKQTNCLQDYKLIGFLGSGSAGYLCKVQHKKTREYFALKLENIDDKELEHDWKLETKIMKRFSEAGIGIRYIDRCVTKLGKRRRGVILMELMDGTLSDFLESMDGVKKAVLDDIAKQIIRLLEVMRDNHISHRDLYFFNIGYRRIENSSKIKLRMIDFDKGSPCRNFWDLELLNIGCELFDGDKSFPKGTPLRYLSDKLWPILSKEFKLPKLQKNPPMTGTEIDKLANALFKQSNSQILLPEKPKKRVLCGMKTKNGKPCGNFKAGCRWHK